MLLPPRCNSKHMTQPSPSKSGHYNDSKTMQTRFFFIKESNELICWCSLVNAVSLADFPSSGSM